MSADDAVSGVPHFMPVLLEQDSAHLVNTSSVFGVFAGALGAYGVSKHAVTALTETLHFNLKTLGVTHVGLSVLGPGAVRTNFGASARNRPASARNRPASAGTPALDEAELAAAQEWDELVAAGATPAAVTSLVTDGIRTAVLHPHLGPEK